MNRTKVLKWWAGVTVALILVTGGCGKSDKDLICATRLPSGAIDPHAPQQQVWGVTISLKFGPRMVGWLDPAKYGTQADEGDGSRCGVPCGLLACGTDPESVIVAAGLAAGVDPAALPTDQSLLVQGLGNTAADVQAGGSAFILDLARRGVQGVGCPPPPVQCPGPDAGPQCVDQGGACYAMASIGDPRACCPGLTCDVAQAPTRCCTSTAAPCGSTAECCSTDYCAYDATYGEDVCCRAAGQLCDPEGFNCCAPYTCDLSGDGVTYTCQF